MTEPAVERDHLAAVPERDQGRAAASRPTGSSPRLGPVRGLVFGPTATAPVIRRDFDFEGKGLMSEPFRFDDDVKQAIKSSSAFAADIAKVKKDLSAISTDTVRADALAELQLIEDFVAKWDGKKVPLTDRVAVIGQVATTTTRLTTIVGDFTGKNKTAISTKKKEQRDAEVEAKNKLAQQEKDKKLREDAERAAAVLLAKQVAAQKVTENKATLGGRGALPAAQNVATVKAAAETAGEEALLKSDFERAQRLSNKPGRERATEARDNGLAELDKRRTESQNDSLRVLANFIGTPAARALSEPDLAWVIENSGVDPRRAKSLAEVITASGPDRTVVGGLAGLSGDPLTITAQHAITLFKKGVLLPYVLSGAKSMAASADTAAYVASAGARMIPGYLALADVPGSKELKEALAWDLQTPGTPYTPQIARQLLAGLESKKPKSAAVYWLTERHSTPEFAQLVALYIDPVVDIDVLRTVLKNATGVYTAVETAGLCQRHSAALPDLASRIADGQPGCPGYVDLVMSTRDDARFGDVRQLAALRAVALLKAGSDKVQVTIGLPPVDFGRGQGNMYRLQNEATDAKTGFVQLGFTDLAGYFEIHTHWNQKEEGRIYSMHVEHLGSNGMEIHTNKVFRPLIDKVVELHNAHYPEPLGGEFVA